MGMSWAGDDIASMAAKLTVEVERDVFNEAEVIVAQTVEEAANEQRELLRSATTRHGEQRYARGQGRGPGRDDSGTMIDSITVTPPRREGDSVIGEWGWDSPEPYFETQDELIPAAGFPGPVKSLYRSFLSARERFFARVGEMVR